MGKEIVGKTRMSFWVFFRKNKVIIKDIKLDSKTKGKKNI